MNSYLYHISNWSSRRPFHVNLRHVGIPAWGSHRLLVDGGEGCWAHVLIWGLLLRWKGLHAWDSGGLRFPYRSHDGSGDGCWWSEVVWDLETEHVFFKSRQIHIHYEQEDLQSNPPSSFWQLC